MAHAKCFIIAPAGTDLSDLTPIVESAGWSILNREGVSPESSAYLAQTSELIAAADAIIVLLGPTASPSLLLEIGFALGAGKSVLLFGDPSKSGVSASSDLLASVPQVHATIRDAQALRLHITAFLDGVRTRERSAGNPPSLQLPFWRKDKSRRQPSTRSDNELEALIEESLEASPEVLQVKAQPLDQKVRRYVPDFVVWVSDTDHKQLGNPIVIEAKHHLRTERDRSELLNRLSNYASVADVSTFVVVVGSEPLSPTQIISTLPMVFQVGAEAFRQLALEGGLIEALKRERNRFVHSVT